MPTSPWSHALFNPLNILMLGASMAAGLISAWWLFPIGLVFWLIMVLKIAYDPALRINHAIQAHSGLPQRFEIPFNRIEKAQVKLFNSLSSQKPLIKKAFQPLQMAVNDLVDQTYQLCVQMTPMVNLLQANSSPSPENELEQLDRLIDALANPAAQKGYERARQALQEKVEQRRTIDEQLGQVDAFLIHLTTEMESLLINMARLQTMDAAVISQQIQDTVDEVRKEIQQIQTLQGKNMP